jgi:hypothetical protein
VVSAVFVYRMNRAAIFMTCFTVVPVQVASRQSSLCSVSGTWPFSGIWPVSPYGRTENLEMPPFHFRSVHNAVKLYRMTDASILTRLILSATTYAFELNTFGCYLSPNHGAFDVHALLHSILAMFPADSRSYIITWCDAVT